MSEVDIHGTDWRKYPRVLSVLKMWPPGEGKSAVLGVMVELNFDPTEADLRSLQEFLQGWHPPSGMSEP